MATWKVTPILAICRIAILKPSELAFVIHSELVNVCTRAGLPPGVFDILIGLGSEASAPLVSHPFVGKIFFVGSAVMEWDHGSWSSVDETCFHWSLAKRVSFLYLRTSTLTRLLNGLPLVVFGPHPDAIQLVFANGKKRRHRDREMTRGA